MQSWHTFGISPVRVFRIILASLHDQILKILPHPRPRATANEWHDAFDDRPCSDDPIGVDVKQWLLRDEVVFYEAANPIIRVREVEPGVASSLKRSIHDRAPIGRFG